MPKTIKNVAYVINLDEYGDVGTHRIALYVINIEIIYFDSFGVEHVPKEIETFIRHKNKHILNTRKQFSNVWISLHWIH